MTLSEDNISRIQCERTFTIYYAFIRRYLSSELYKIRDVHSIEQIICVEGRTN